MYWGMDDIFAFGTLGSARLKEDCEMPDLSPTSL